VVNQDNYSVIVASTGVVNHYAFVMQALSLP